MNWTSICWKGQADLTDPFNVSKLLQLNLAFSPHRLLQETTTLEGLRFKILHQKNDGLLHMNIMNCPLVPNFWAIPPKKNSVVPAFWLALSGEHSQLWSCLVPPSSTAGRYEMTNVKRVLNDKSNPGVARVAHFFKCLLLLHKDWQPLSGGHRRKTILWMKCLNPETGLFRQK